MQGEDIADLVAATLNIPERQKLVEIATALQDFIGYGMLMGEGDAPIKTASGVKILWDVLVKASQNAKFVGLGEVDSTNIMDGIVAAEIPWKHFTSNFGYEEREIAMQGTAEKIVDLILTRRAMDTVDVAEKLEDAFWDMPASAADSKIPFGMNYWLVVNATKGFNGGAPFGSTVANINCTTYANWKNWTAQYTAVSKADFVAKVREGMVRVPAQRPQSQPDCAAWRCPESGPCQRTGRTGARA